MVQGKVAAQNFLKKSKSASYFVAKSEPLNPNGVIAQSGKTDSGTLNWKQQLKFDLHGFKQILLVKLNVLLIFVPLGFISALVTHSSSLTIFSFNFVAMIPLASLLGTATEELANHTGDKIGGLVNATLGNAVEMVITVQALKLGLVKVVQGTLLGSILSNLLLVLGMSFFAGGCTRTVQSFSAEGATCSTSLLLLASLSIICPTVVEATGGTDVLEISRYTAVLIAVTYVLFLYFQLVTHLAHFKAKGNVDLGEVVAPEEEALMSQNFCILVLAAVTINLAFQSHFLVGSIEAVVNEFGLTEGFIGVILLPIVGNGAEHLTAVTCALNDKIDLTMGVAVGSSTQIAMFMVPFAVLVGWGLDVPMTLAFSNLAVTILVFSILIVIGVVQDGQSNWFEGVMLMVAYLVIAVVFWFEKNE